VVLYFLSSILVLPIIENPDIAMIIPIRLTGYGILFRTGTRKHIRVIKIIPIMRRTGGINRFFIMELYFNQ